MTKLPSQPNIDEIADELDAQISKQEPNVDQGVLSNSLNEALDELKLGKSPTEFSADPEFQTALRLHVMSSDSEIDEDFNEELEQIILNKCVTQPAKEKKSEHHKPKLTFWLIPSLSVAAVVAVIFIITQSSLPSIKIDNQTTQSTTSSTKQESPALKANSQKTNTINSASPSLAADNYVNTSPTLALDTNSETTITNSNDTKNDQEESEDITQSLANLNDVGSKNNANESAAKTETQTQLDNVEELKTELEATISSLEELLNEVENFEAVLDQQDTEMDILISELSEI